MEEGRPAQGPGSKAGPRGAPAAAVPPDLGRIARRRRRLPRNEWGPCRSRPRDAAAPSAAGAGSPFPAASFAQRGSLAVGQARALPCAARRALEEPVPRCVKVLG